MTISDFIFSCATDNVPAYFTYEGENMLIVQSKEGAKNQKNDFEQIEGFMRGKQKGLRIKIIGQQLGFFDPPP